MSKWTLWTSPKSIVPCEICGKRIYPSMLAHVNRGWWVRWYHHWCLKATTREVIGANV